MASKTFCPLMTIGFEPPEKGQRDNRLCMKDCAWYNVQEEKCQINVIAEKLEGIDISAGDISGFTSDIALEVVSGGGEDGSFGYDPETATYYSGFSKRT